MQMANIQKTCIFLCHALPSYPSRMVRDPEQMLPCTDDLLFHTSFENVRRAVQ